MTSNDINFFKYCFTRGWVHESLLDVGSSTFGGAQLSISMVAKDLGLKQVTGVDLAKNTGVDVVFDFSVKDETFEGGWEAGSFNTVVVFNVLEHTFDPYQVLKNAAKCLKPGGTLLVVVPVVWPIHSFPKDHCRLLPDWFEEFARREGLSLVKEGFVWLSEFEMSPVDGVIKEGERQYPNFLNQGKLKSPLRYWSSRITHRILNTFGRSHSFNPYGFGCRF
ncbi:MAG: methyltransferase domain-containing protein [Proteobacteria bacterium]|nr:methyltransferase domain-containing protein [Pseudomonadota bacterium]